MFSYRITVAFVAAFMTTIGHASVTIPFNFNTVFHTQKFPLKKMHALCMEVWGTIDAGINDPVMLQSFQENHICLLSRVMMIQSMFDTLVGQLSDVMNDDPDYYDYVLEEIEYLYEVLQDAHKSYQEIVSNENTYTFAIAHVLELILQKIAFLLQTRLAISPYYALSRFYYPKAITPSFVPAYILPVAPIG
jgi:hypothetical protein